MKYLVGKVWTPVYAQIDMKNATITIKDGGSNEITLKIGEGNLTYTERKTIEYTLDRGVLDEVREGDEVPVEVRMDVVWEYLTGPSVSSTVASGGLPTPEDVLKFRGGASAWASTDSDACRPKSVDIEIVYDPDCVGDKETITLADFRYEQIDHDARAGTLSCTGRCNIKDATVVRAA